jgi:hypothetical protein
MAVARYYATAAPEVPTSTKTLVASVTPRAVDTSSADTEKLKQEAALKFLEILKHVIADAKLKAASSSVPPPSPPKLLPRVSIPAPFPRTRPCKKTCRNGTRCGKI